MTNLSPEQVRKNMVTIRSKDTKRERILCKVKRQSRAVRRELWKKGIRYRLNHSKVKRLL